MDVEYPIFHGKVVSVPAIIEHGDTVMTVVDYLLPSEEEELRKKTGNLFHLMTSKGHDEAQEALEKAVHRAGVPMRLDPSVIDGCDIRSSFGRYTVNEDGQKKTYKTYEVEVLRGRSQAGGDALAMLGEVIGSPKHTGFKYVRILEEIV